MLLDDSERHSDFPSCHVCRHDENARARWGCDAELEEPLFDMTCVVCSAKDHHCPRCKGSGRMPIKRCPWATINNTHGLIVQSAVIHHETGETPNGLGLYEQTGPWYDARLIVSRILAEKMPKMPKPPK